MEEQVAGTHSRIYTVLIGYRGAGYMCESDWQWKGQGEDSQVIVQS